MKKILLLFTFALGAFYLGQAMASSSLASCPNATAGIASNTNPKVVLASTTNPGGPRGRVK